MRFDGRPLVWSKDRVRCDNKDVPRPARVAGKSRLFGLLPSGESDPEPTWGSRRRTIDEIMTGATAEPDPGVRVLAEQLAAVIFSDAEREQYFEALCAFLATLPPPDVMPEVKIRAQELRQHCGIPIVMEDDVQQAKAPPAPVEESSITPPPVTPPALR